MNTLDNILQAAQRVVEITRVGPALARREDNDAIAVEEPLEIRLGRNEQGRVNHQAVSVTMRTPGDDFELAAGFLFTEGILQNQDQVAAIKHCGRDASPTNTIRVDLAPGTTVEIKRLERNFYTTSSSGVCGKTSLAALATGAEKVRAPESLRVAASSIDGLPAKLRAQQEKFQTTGEPSWQEYRSFAPWVRRRASRLKQLRNLA